MAAEIVQITPQDFLSQNYQTQDVNLITSFAVSTFLSSSSYIEFFIYDNNKNILDSDYNFIEYTILVIISLAVRSFESNIIFLSLSKPYSTLSILKTSVTPSV